eukprot:TRINITY_DN32569_c0_g1_i1.p1 TRINITY_DN32569_c0_g1~~TRINITY_DN32569_c0_g1_i1.p1  ORF type:complete len:366 (+),score=90.86 TRINITY_DN32569_c0_g1_i1:84-1181(+)
MKAGPGPVPAIKKAGSPLVAAGGTVTGGSTAATAIAKASPRTGTSSLRQAGAALLGGPTTMQPLAKAAGDDSTKTTPRPGSVSGASTAAPASGVGTAQSGISTARSAVGAAVIGGTTAPAGAPLSARSPGAAVAGEGEGKKPAAEGAAKAAAVPKAAAPAPGASSVKEIDGDAVLKFHSAVRWAKPWEEIEAVVTGLGVDMRSACAGKDPKTGNQALHIASQNGHMELVEKLVGAGSPPNGQNNKGQTPLHMAVEYDFYFVCKFLFANGADGEVKNGDGHKAITGIDGGKVGAQAWDNPVTVLKAASNAEQVTAALDMLEQMVSKGDASNIDKAELIQAGMAKKKAATTKDVWDHKRFMGIAAKC